jgi:hypothetical protein
MIVGNVKKYRSGALLVTTSRSTSGTTVQRYAVRDTARDVAPDTFDDALADADSSNATPNAAGTITLSRNVFNLLSLASQVSFDDIVSESIFNTYAT